MRPVDTKILTNWPNIDPHLKNQPYNSVDGQMYGAPHGYGANLLAYNTKTSRRRRTAGRVVYDPTANKGKVTVYDDPITIADAALYLSKTQPDLKITNPYELDQKQFDAAVALMKKQRPLDRPVLGRLTKQQQALHAGRPRRRVDLAVHRQPAGGRQAADQDDRCPKEGATGWSDTWMLSSKAKHPNCMLKWMNWIETPKAQAQVAEWFGEAPANLEGLRPDRRTRRTARPSTPNDDAFFDQVKFWATPTRNCRDGRGNSCVDYSKWVQAWTEIKG